MNWMTRFKGVFDIQVKSARTEFPDVGLNFDQCTVINDSTSQRIDLPGYAIPMIAASHL